MPLSFAADSSREVVLLSRVTVIVAGARPLPHVRRNGWDDCEHSPRVEIRTSTTIAYLR
jgi:hypothetical protein